MAPLNVKLWKNDAKYNDLLNYVIKQTENVESTINILQLARDFKKKSGDTQTENCLRFRVYTIRNVIHKIGHIDTNTKVKVLFALSAPVDAVFLKHLRKDALVKVDKKKRIIHYKANDGNFELKGNHNLLEKRSVINKYFKNKNDNDEEPNNKKGKEVWNLIQLITEKCENINSPLNITQLTKDFNNQFGISRAFSSIYNRIRSYCHKIQKTELLNTSSKVKQLFGLGATLDSNFLKELRKDAVVEVDELNRITKYTANDGRLTLHGDHSRSEKSRTARLESKGSLRSLITSYFEEKNNADAVPTNEEEGEMWKLIEYITEKCDTADTPLCFTQLTKDFNNNFGKSRSVVCICKRVKAYCHEVQKTEFLDSYSKVKQLFYMSAKLDSGFLKKLRKDAAVEVDDLNRITKYTANDGRLILHGDHSSSAKRLNQIERRKNKNAVKKHCISDDDEDEESEKKNGYSEDESDEYSSEEFDSEFDSDEENDHLDETTDLIETSSKADDFDNETPVRNLSPIEMSIDNDFDFDPSPEKENDIGIIGNGRISERYKRFKKRYSDLEEDSDSQPKDGNDECYRENFGSDSDSDDENDDLNKKHDLMKPSNEAYDSNNETSVRKIAPSGISFDNNIDFDPPTERSHISEEIEMRNDDPEITENAAVKTQKSETVPNNKNSSSTSHTPKTPKRKTNASAGSSTSKRTKPPSDKSMNPGEMNADFSHDDQSSEELNSFRGPLGLPNETQKDADIQQIPKSRPQVIEAPIKQEYEEESQTSLNTVLQAFKSLTLSLDISGLLPFQIELDKKIMETGSGVEVSNKEVLMAMDFFIVKLSKHGALKSSEESISLRDILLMLRTIILNSSFNDFEVILKMLKENIEQLKVLDKKVPVSKVECVLRATLDSIST